MSVNPNYRSYLLRLWRDQPDDPWRAALQSTTTGERINFAEVSEMFDFLLATLSAPPALASSTAIAPHPDDNEQ